jgi:superoxide oxidase
MASLGHLALYALMLVMPVMGWLALSAAGKPIPFFGLEMPPLMAPNKTWAHDIKELHETVGVAGYWLIGIHVAAALGHHYVLKDGLLSRMSVLRSPLAA